MPDPVPVPLTDIEAWAKGSEKFDIMPDPGLAAVCEALRIAVEALSEVAVDHEPMPVNDGRDWCSKCQNYMRGDSGCTAADATAALAAVRELVDLGGDK